MVALFDEFNSAKNKENLIMLLLNRKKKLVLKGNGKKKCTNYKNIFCFLILKTTMFQKIFQKTVWIWWKKSNFVKKDKTIVRSIHLPLNTFIINCKGIKINASPFEIAEIIDANTPISTETKKIIEQSNFVNNSLHIIGQQLGQIEEKIEKPTSSKTENLWLIYLAKGKALRLPRKKIIEKVEQMLLDLPKKKKKRVEYFY